MYDFPSVTGNARLLKMCRIAIVMMYAAKNQFATKMCRSRRFMMVPKNTAP
jgi:hypothetical protein